MENGEREREAQRVRVGARSEEIGGSSPRGEVIGQEAQNRNGAVLTIASSQQQKVGRAKKPSRQWNDCDGGRRTGGVCGGQDGMDKSGRIVYSLAQESGRRFRSDCSVIWQEMMARTAHTNQTRLISQARSLPHTAWQRRPWQRHATHACAEHGGRGPTLSRGLQCVCVCVCM